MARIQYQQSQGKGWSNIDPGYISLSRMREKQREDEQGEDRRLQEEKERNAQAEANVERIQKATEANLKEINIESKVSQTQEAALRVNKNIAEQNFEAETKRNKVKSTLETLIELAPSAIQAKQKMDQADWEVTYKNAVQYYSTYGIEENRKFRTDLLEDEAFLGGQRLELKADILQDDNAPSEQVMFVRGKNKAVDYALMKVKAMDAGNNYKSTLQTALLKAGLTDPAEQEAFINDFNIRYLQGHGLVTNNGKPISADFLGPTFEKMSNARSSILGRSRLQKALTDSQAHADKYKSIAITALQNTNENIDIKREAAENWLNRLKRVATDIYGTRPNGTEVKETFLKGLVYSGASSDVIQEILEKIPYPPGGEGANWYDNRGNKQLISKYLNEYQADKKVAEGLKAQQEKFDQDQEFDQFDADIKSGAIPLSSEVLEDKFAEWRNKKYDQSIIQERFGHLTEETPAGSQDGNVYLQDAKEKVDDFTATYEDVTNPKLPKNAFTQEEIATVVRNQELKKVANYEGNFKKNIDDALWNRINTKQVKETGQRQDISYRNAVKGAELMFDKCIVGGSDRNFCHKQLTEELDKEDGLFQTKGYGDDDKEKGREGQPDKYFVNFTFKAEQAKKLSVDHFPLNTTEEFNMFVELNDNGDTVKTAIVIHPDYVKAFSKRVENGLPFDYHPIAVEMSRLHPDKYPEPHDFIREQAYLMKKAGIEGFNEGTLNLKTLRRAWGDHAEDPLVSHKIMSALTNTDLKKGLVLAADPSISRAPYQMTPVVQEAFNTLEQRRLNPETSENYPLFGLENHQYTQEFNLTG